MSEEFIARCEKAARTVDELANTARGHNAAYLHGKAVGVRLAISYAREMLLTGSCPVCGAPLPFGADDSETDECSTCGAISRRPGAGVETATIRIDRSELIPGGGGALLGYSDQFPDKQFLILPEAQHPIEVPDAMMPEESAL